MARKRRTPDVTVQGLHVTVQGAPPTRQALKGALDLAKAEEKAKREAYDKANKELRDHQEVAKALQKQLDDQRDQAFLEALTPELVDVLAPEHSRTSCSDDNRYNADRGCTRCALLEAKNMNYLSFKWSFEVKFSDDGY